MLLHGGHDALLDLAVDLRVGFVIDARHLLVALGDDAHLRGRRPGGIADEPGAMPAVSARVGERCRRFVLAGHRDERRAPAERRDVVRHVGRAADAMGLVIERHDRDGRLRRDARDAARR